MSNSLNYNWKEVLMLVSAEEIAARVELKKEREEFKKLGGHTLPLTTEFLDGLMQQCAAIKTTRNRKRSIRVARPFAVSVFPREVDMIMACDTKVYAFGRNVDVLLEYHGGLPHLRIGYNDTDRLTLRRTHVCATQPPTWQIVAKAGWVAPSGRSAGGRIRGCGPDVSGES